MITGKKWTLHQRFAGRRKNSQENPRKLSMLENILLQRCYWTRTTSVAYSISVDHSRRILSVTAGHIGSRNDKTIRQFKFDKFVQNLRPGTLYANAQFELFIASGEIVCICGLYVLYDGSHHKWRIMHGMQIGRIIVDSSQIPGILVCRMYPRDSTIPFQRSIMPYNP